MFVFIVSEKNKILKELFKYCIEKMKRSLNLRFLSYVEKSK